MSLLKNIPEELKTYNNWVGWKWEEKKNSRGVEKWTKPPYDLKSNGTLRHAKTDDPMTWAPFEAAEAECSGFESRFDGVGIVLPPALGGVDFDGIIVDEKPEPFVLEILKHLGNPYAEITPSDNGLRAIIKAPTLPADKGRKFHGKKPGIDKYGAEIYFGAEPGRYLTITGKKFSGNGISTPPDIDLAHFLMSQIGNEKFKNLWTGGISDYGDDQSAADLALASILARRLHNDNPRIEKYFSASILGQRDKWTQRQDYRDRTIEKAISGKESNASPTKSASKELKFHLPAVETGSHHDCVVAPALGQNDGWFPLGAFSLVGGSSGGGKTTMLYQLLLEQAIKARFFGHETYGRSYLTLGVDRGEDAHKRTLERMHLELTSLPFKPLPVTAWNTDAAQAIVNQIEATNPLPEIVFIEGVDMLVTEGNQIKAVTKFAHELQQIAQHYHLAIIGSAGAPKTKEGHGYAAARDNVLGSTGWARVAETMAVLQFPKGDDSSGQRKLTVMLRNAPAEKFTLGFVNGLLKVQPDNEEESEGKSGQAAEEIEWFQAQARLAKTDSTKKWFTILDMERALNLKHATADRHVRDSFAKKYLKRKPGGKSGWGSAAEYRWNESKTNRLWVEQQKQEAAEQNEAL